MLNISDRTVFQDKTYPFSFPSQIEGNKHFHGFFSFIQLNTTYNMLGTVKGTGNTNMKVLFSVFSDHLVSSQKSEWRKRY